MFYVSISSFTIWDIFVVCFFPSRWYSGFTSGLFYVLLSSLLLNFIPLVLIRYLGLFLFTLFLLAMGTSFGAHFRQRFVVLPGLYVAFLFFLHVSWFIAVVLLDLQKCSTSFLCGLTNVKPCSPPWHCKHVSDTQVWGGIRMDGRRVAPARAIVAARKAKATIAHLSARRTRLAAHSPASSSRARLA